jgi:glycosyltransferase involved in cell wall biosynthesis
VVNVLFVTTNWPSEESPIDGTFVREHARVVARFADVRVIHLKRARGASLLGLEHVDDDLPVVRARYRRYGKPVSVAAFMAAPFVAQRRLARQGWRADVIHAHSFLSALPALALGRVLRRPVVYTEHWTVFLPENPATLSWPQRSAARLALGRADLVLPVSGASAAALRALSPRARLQVVPNAVDEELFHPPGDKPRDGGVRLLTAGRMDDDAKGVDVLLESVARLPADRPVHLDVVGGGTLRRSYEELARRLGLADLVTFRGLLPKPEVAELMRGADLFVLASRYENNPCVLIEAMASGLPVVATRVGGVPELVTDRSGLLVEPDVGSVARGLESALGLLQTFDSAAIARDTVSRYGRGAVGRLLQGAYASVGAVAVEESER